MAGPVKLLARNLLTNVKRLSPEINCNRNWEISPWKTLRCRSITHYSQDDWVQFQQLQPKRIKSNDLKLLQIKRPLYFFDGFSRSFFFRRKDDKPKNRKKRVPKLILIQNPLTWLMIKIDFGVLRTVWDPTFVEKEFKFGTKQVHISKIKRYLQIMVYCDLLVGLGTVKALFILHSSTQLFILISYRSYT